MIAFLETLLLMAATAVGVLLLTQLGPALGWPVPVTLAVPAAAFLIIGAVAARRGPRGNHHG